MRPLRDQLPRFWQVVAVAVFAHVLAITAMVACPALHEWVHPDAHSDGHDCAVVLFASGGAEAATVVILVIALVVRSGSQALPSCDRVEGIFRVLRILEHAPPAAA